MLIKISVLASRLKINPFATYIILEIKPCGLGSRIQDMDAESYN